MKNFFKPWIFAAFAACAAILPARAQSPVLDPSFAITSAVRMNFGGGPGSDIRDMLRQPDGKLVVAGDFRSINGRPAPRVARLLPDGQVDTTFTAPLADGDILTIALQADGKLLVGGYFHTVGGQSRIGIARLLPTGALDPSFLSPFGSTQNFSSNISKVVAQPGRGILVFGVMVPITPTPFSSFYAARLLEATGARDATFQPAFNTFDIRDVLVQPSGQLVFAGRERAINGRQCIVWGALPDGALDPAFVPLPSPTPSAFVPTAYELTRDPATGNLYVVMLNNSAGGLLSEPVRLLPTGVRDPTFSTAGTFVAGSTVGGVNSVAVQPNGRLLLGGTIPVVGGGFFGTARLLPSGALDLSYDISNGPQDAVTKVLVQPNGALLFAGSFHQVQSLPVDCLTRMLDANVLSARAPSWAEEVDAWPVPTREVLHLGLPAGRVARQAALLDGLGRVVLRQALPSGQPAPALPTAGLPPGTYLLRVDFGSGPPAYRRVAVE